MIDYNFTTPIVKFAEITEQRKQVLIKVESVIIQYQKETNTFLTIEEMVHLICAACMCLFLFALFNYIY